MVGVQATEDKNNAIAQAEKTATKAKLADRLINGLSGENKRWNETIAKFGVAEGGACEQYPCFSCITLVGGSCHELL